jgi:hypothetical protein
MDDALPAALGRLAAHIVIDDGHWLWQLGRDAKGYGRARHPVHGKVRRLHIITWELLVGPRTPGLQLDHVCRIRHCCQPLHLEEVTAAVNTDRGAGRKGRHLTRTHCSNGHVLALDGYIDPHSGRWRCRACRRRT